MVEKNNIAAWEIGYTHAGVFHADDCMAAAMLEIVCPSIKISRVNTVTPEMLQDPDAIVFDIGGGHYDHHQADAAHRADGKKYAACGLVFEDIKDYLMGDLPDEVAEQFRAQFIVPIEDWDNGEHMATPMLSSMIAMLNPSWDELTNEEQEKEWQADNEFVGWTVYDAQCNDVTAGDYSMVGVNWLPPFREGVQLCKRLIQRFICRARSKQSAEADVRLAATMAEDGVAVLPKFMPWQDTMLGFPELRFVVFPSLRGGYSVQGIPAQKGSRDLRVKLPEEWLTDKPEGCTFVHPSLFLASFKTQEQAISAAKAVQ